MGNADYPAGIVNSNVEFAALRIGKAAYPLEVFVAPSFLPFDILTFLHGDILVVYHTQTHNNIPLKTGKSTC